MPAGQGWLPRCGCLSEGRLLAGALVTVLCLKVCPPFRASMCDCLCSSRRPDGGVASGSGESWLRCPCFSQSAFLTAFYYPRLFRGGPCSCRQRLKPVPAGPAAARVARQLRTCAESRENRCLNIGPRLLPPDHAPNQGGHWLRVRGR